MGNNAHVGWGCIRLTPSLHSPLEPKKELKPAVRRSSSVHEGSPGSAPLYRRTSSTAKSIGSGFGTSPKASSAMPMPIKIREAFESESALVIDDDDDDDEHGARGQVKLMSGYRSGTGSDEDDEESADEIVAREVERRGAKEG